MSEASEQMGLEFFPITDHFSTLPVEVLRSGLPGQLLSKPEPGFGQV